MRGLLQGWTGRLGEAKRNLEQAIQVAGEDGDAETEAWAHMMLVAVGELADAPEEVLAHAREAVAIAEVAAGTFSRALAQQFLGIAHVVRSEWDDAVAALERALSIYRERDVGLEEESMSLAFLARARLGRGDAAAALAAADEAVRLASRRGTKAFEMHARHRRARALLAIGGRSAAAAAGDEIQRAGARGENRGPVLRAALAPGARRAGPAARLTRPRDSTSCGRLSA